MTNERKLPEGRLGRLRRLAGLGARTGASLLFNRDGGQAAAEQAAEVLGTLRGLAAKVGQMASYIDGLVPESHRESYETALRGLRAAAPTSSPAQIRAAIQEEFGAPVEELFAEWNDTPLASASIGQVHRARLLDGREVAVKVQHPGIAAAVASDLNNAGMLQGMIAALGPRQLNSKAVYDEIRQRFEEELDYELEAERQNFFRRLHAGDQTIDIPEVIAERSKKRVLTTILKHGTSLEEAAQQDVALRESYAKTLWRFVFKGNLVGGMFNADPHPGNYMFQSDGKIVFLDFGCIQPLRPDHLAHARTAHRAALHRDMETFRRSMIGMVHSQGGEYEAQMLVYLRRCFDPLFESPFRMTREYVASLVEMMRNMTPLMISKNTGFVPVQQGLVFLNRLQFGFYSVLARLDVTVDYLAVESEFLDAAGL